MVILKKDIKISSNLILFMIYLSILGDYLITYWGIHNLNFIEEANPLLVSIMAMPLSQGLWIKVILGLIPLIILKLIENKFEEPRCYKIILLGIFILQLYPYCLHSCWLFSYLKFILG